MLCRSQITVTLKNSTSGQGIDIPEYKSVPAVEYKPYGWFFNHLAMANRKEKAVVSAQPLSTGRRSMVHVP